MASLRTTFVTFALIGLFIFAMISFIVTTQQDNDVSETILENPVINKTYTKLETNLSGLESQTQAQRANFSSEIPERGFGTLIIFSIVPVLQKFLALIVGVYNVIIVLPASIIGISPVVFSVLSSILIVSLILFVWSAIRVGR